MTVPTFEEFVGRLRHPDTGAPVELEPWQRGLLQLLYGEDPNADPNHDMRRAMCLRRSARPLVFITTADQEPQP